MKNFNFGFALLLGLFLACGCSNSKDNDEKTSEKENEAKVAKQDWVAAAEGKLIGIWLGSAFLEETLVVEKLESSWPGPNDKDDFVSSAETFLTTVMAIQFKQDGTMEQQIELTLPNGQKEDMIGVGVWKVLDAEAGKALVQVTEVNPDATESVSERVFTFSDNGNEFVIPAPVGDELAACKALLIFERQADVLVDRTAENRNEDVSR